ncbi:MAG: NAD(P)H-quinone oxidoreductase [Gammaproteobacteria bacterium]|nr:NAD(P)H-quinone oxidoreductase [Gammaproteobacteria bacterium]
MKAIDIQDGELVWADVADPTPGPGEILIRNEATAVNRADLVQRAGGYPPPPGASPILGLECAGEVTAVGEGVSSFTAGDRVCALLAGGGYAEQVVVPAGQARRIPGSLSAAEAASLPEVYATAWLNLFMEARLEVGERVLIHAGASGVGTAGIQLCRAFGNPVWVTAGSVSKVDRCIELGAAGGHDRHAGSLRDQVEGWTDGAGFDVILDPVGAAYLSDNLRAMALEGRLLLIGLMGGAKAELELGLVLMKRLRVIGSTLRARSVAAKSAVMDQLEARVWPKLADGSIKPVIEAEFPITQAADAHALIAGNDTFGKVVLTF